MSVAEIALLVGGGLLAGAVNTLAGGGSLLTVPLLVLIGLPGTVANGTNRVGILFQSLFATRSFQAAGVSAFGRRAPIFAPLAVGTLVGALGISRVADQTFERLFGLLMLLLVVPALWRPPRPGDPAAARRGGSRWTSVGIYFGIGLYAGAVQAGVGIALLSALTRSGFDLVRANAIKMLAVAALASVAVPVFALAGQVAWLPALLLAAGTSAGGVIGVRIAVRGGERAIRPVATAAVAALAGHMLGLY